MLQNLYQIYKALTGHPDVLLELKNACDGIESIINGIQLPEIVTFDFENKQIAISSQHLA